MSKKATEYHWGSTEKVICEQCSGSGLSGKAPRNYEGRTRKVDGIWYKVCTKCDGLGYYKKRIR